MAAGTTQRLLSAVWGNRKGFVFLPFKDLARTWNETPGVPYDGSSIPSLEELPKADIYFCPVVFEKGRRKKEFALPTSVLWADLDPIHPDQCRLRPSVAWESSPGRYQALWFITSEIAAEEAAALSKRIAYADGADKGGWDVTQVLRLPGTKNYKYEAAPPVRLLWAKKAAYSTSEVKAAYPPVNGEAASSGEAPVDWPVVSEMQINSAIAALPAGLRVRLTRDPRGADRSLELQKLARDLIRFGVEPGLVAHMLQRSTFNKFAGRPTEQRDLLREVESAKSAVAQRSEPKQAREPIEQMDVHTWADFMQIPTRLRWLIDDAWVDQTVGFISGRSKSYKTWIALDLALSVVSGSPFLGRYDVRRTGPVLLIQEEDPSAVLQERLRLIGKMKGMLPILKEATQSHIRVEYPDYPLHIINLQGFNLGVQEKVDQVRQLIAKIDPIMVILDPLIVLLPQGVDEYKGAEISMVLQSVKMWREEFGCSVVIVHHWNKGKNESGERFAEHMYGSFAFHAWLESALHVMPVIEEEQEKIDTILVEREFKAAPSGRPLKLRFDIDTIKNYEYHVIFEDDKSLSPAEQQLVDLIAESGSTGASTPEIIAATGHARSKVLEHLGRLVRAKIITAKKGGGRGISTRYWLPEHASSH